MRFLLCLCITFACWAQPFTVTLHPQERHIGRFREVVVTVKNQTGDVLNVQPADVWDAVKLLGFQPETRSNINMERNSICGMSWQRKTGILIAPNKSPLTGPELSELLSGWLHT